MSKSAIIIGAGPGGLATALLLAAAGLRVKILERLPWVGGRTSSLQAEGYTFDLGPTFFLYPRVLSEIFAATGHDLFKEVQMTRLDPQYRILFGEGGALDATPDAERMGQQIARLAPEDATGFGRFMAENRTKLRLFEPCLETPFLGWKDVATLRLLRLLPWLEPQRSVESYLKKFFNDPRVRLAFCFQSKYLGMSPFRCPSLFSILSFLEYEYGVWHPAGGCAALSRAMARLAERMGVEIVLNQPVQEIVFEGRRAAGVRTASGLHRADAVVMNADFAQAIQRLMPEALRPGWTNPKIAAKKYSCSTFMMYLGVQGRYDLPHHNIYISSSYERNLREIEDEHLLSSDPSFYVQNASVTDPTLAPPGHSALYVLVPVTHQHGNVDWSRERARYRDVVMGRLAAAGFDGVADRIRYERVLTPADWEHRYAIYRGATFNLAHTLGQMLHLRPRNRFEGVERMYLVGGGTHPGSGLPVIFQSARISAQLLLDDLGIQRPRRVVVEQAEDASQLKEQGRC